MKKLFLHIGSYKTGTTSIQSALAINRAMLARQGFSYPGKDVNHHKFIFTCFPAEKDIPRQFQGIEKSTLNQIISNFNNDIEIDFNSIHKKQIISTEYLFIHDKSYVTRTSKYLKRFFSEIEIIVYVRNPIDYISSYQQQMIKARSYLDFLSDFYYNFKNVIETWKAFYPVKVLKYDRSVNSLDVFCKAVGLDIGKFQIPEKRSNTSLKLEQMLLLEKIQDSLYKDYENRFKNHLGVLHQIEYSGLHKPRLKKDVQNLIYKNHYNDLLWLKENYDVDFIDEKYNIDSKEKLPIYNREKVSIRDIFEVPDEELVQKYEAYVIDALLKTLVKQSTSR